MSTQLLHTLRNRNILACFGSIFLALFLTSSVKAQTTTPPPPIPTTVCPLGGFDIYTVGPGEHTFNLDGTRLASVVYYARISYRTGDAKPVMVRKRWNY